MHKNAHRFFYYYLRITDELYKKGDYMEERNDREVEELTALVSLNRPGLEKKLLEYIKNKFHPEQIKYECLETEPILSPTYGCILYHEQIEEILSSLGGFSPEQSKQVRKNMAKGKTSIRAEEKHVFVYGDAEKGISGCVAKGISFEAAGKVFDDCCEAAGYTFNKAHAIVYIRNLCGSHSE